MRVKWSALVIQRSLLGQLILNISRVFNRGSSLSFPRIRKWKKNERCWTPRQRTSLWREAQGAYVSWFCIFLLFIFSGKTKKWVPIYFEFIFFCSINSTLHYCLSKNWDRNSDVEHSSWLEQASHRTYCSPCIREGCTNRKGCWKHSQPAESLKEVTINLDYYDLRSTETKL